MYILASRRAEIKLGPAWPLAAPPAPTTLVPPQAKTKPARPRTRLLAQPWDPQTNTINNKVKNDFCHLEITPGTLPDLPGWILDQNIEVKTKVEISSNNLDLLSKVDF